MKRKESQILQKKWVKSCCFACMAAFMGLLTVCGSACTPTKNNLSSSPPTSSNAVQSVPSPLGLDPENDPVIYTTESGLEIKYGGLDIEGTLASGALKGYPYFTMGSYGGAAVNWVIIGRALGELTISAGAEGVPFSAWRMAAGTALRDYFFNNYFETNTPAGAAIYEDIATKAYIATTELGLDFIVENSEIPAGSVLAFCERGLGVTWFDSGASWSSDYNSNIIINAFVNLYNSGLGLTDSQKSKIVPQTVTNICNGSSTTTSSNQYLFPLAARGEKFDIARYLTTDSSRILNAGDLYWLRSGDSIYGAWIVNASGTVTTSALNEDRYVRPACVISLE